MSARVRAGPRFGGLSLEGLSLEDLSPGGPLLGGPPVSVPAGFGVVPIPGVGVMLDGVPVPIPGVGVRPVPGLAPVPIPGVGAMKVPPPPPTPPPPIPGEGARAPPVPCARAMPALPAESIAAKTTTNFGCVMIALACIELCFVNWPDIGAEVNDKARPSAGFPMPFKSLEGHVAAVRAQKSDRVSLNNSNAMKAVHAALATRPTGMVATTSTSRTIYIRRS
jgi:hypothetical protein